MTVSDYLANKLIDAVLRSRVYSPGSIWIGLHSADPGITGASEIVHPNYGRQQVSTTGWGAAASRQSSNVSAIQWPNMPSAALTHIGIWEVVSAGNFLVGSALSPGTVVLASGDTFQINANRLVVTFL